MTPILKWQGKVYLFLIFFISLITFVVGDGFSIPSLKDWVFVYFLVAAVLLLSYFSVHLPPKDNSFSMDSAIYLAVMFLYGISLALKVLLISILVEFLYKTVDEHFSLQ
ncbi:hypothetical protein GT50_18530 [Geobacillus stearothermophilus 10]|nr:hypothetical protein GT50_18530 [Geobacillus stearothermophilus 10]